MAKIVVGGRRVEERLGDADDVGACADALPYPAAVASTLAWCSQQQQAISSSGVKSARKALTVGSAIESYIAARVARSAKAGANASVRLRLHVSSDEKFASIAMRKLRAIDIQDWRQRVTVQRGARHCIGPSTINRLLNDLRAALNAAAETHRRELPAHLPAEIKAGTKALSIGANARKQILSEIDVRAIVNAARHVDEDFGPIVLLAAATGARFSQLAALRVGDLQPARGRILVPSSRKGRGTKPKPPVAIPLSPSAIEQLVALTIGREADEPLLTRWGYRNAGGLKWEKHERRAWGAAYEIEKFWSATVAEAKSPAGTIMYALRHSSIVRGLCAGLPVRLVAAAHDTSVEMIEAHYSAYIVDATEDLHRKHAFSLC